MSASVDQWHERFVQQASWTNQLRHFLYQQVGLKSDERILDVGCGSGKQCFSYWDELSGKADITGGDVSADLLSQAKAENDRRNAHIQFDYLDFNQPFQYANDVFDFVSCCFAIYYAENIPQTIEEMHRITNLGQTVYYRTNAR